MGSRRGLISGLAAAAIVALVATAGPAQAVAPSSVTSGTPTWSSGVLRGTGSFVPAAAGTYFSTQILYRTTSSRAPVCTVNGCASSSTMQVGLTAYGTITTTAAQNRRSVPLQVITANCPATPGVSTRYYWTWTKVSDSTGSFRVVLSRAYSGRFC